MKNLEGSVGFAEVFFTGRMGIAGELKTYLVHLHLRTVRVDTFEYNGNIFHYEVHKRTAERNQRIDEYLEEFSIKELNGINYIKSHPIVSYLRTSYHSC